MSSNNRKGLLRIKQWITTSYQSIGYVGVPFLYFDTLKDNSLLRWSELGLVCPQVYFSFTSDKFHWKARRFHMLLRGLCNRARSWTRGESSSLQVTVTSVSDHFNLQHLRDRFSIETTDCGFCVEIGWCRPVPDDWCHYWRCGWVCVILSSVTSDVDSFFQGRPFAELCQGWRGMSPTREGTGWSS